MCVFVEVERRRNESRPEWEFCFIAPCWPVAWSHFSFSLCFIKQRGGGGVPIRSAGLRWSQPPHPPPPPSFNPHPPPNTHTHPVTDWYSFRLDWSLCRDTHRPWPIQLIRYLQRCAKGGCSVCVCVFDPSMQSDKDQDAEMKTNTPYVHPPPSQTHTHTLTHTVVVFVLLWWVA